jgi:hypothetical protein
MSSCAASSNSATSLARSAARAAPSPPAAAGCSNASSSSSSGAEPDCAADARDLRAAEGGSGRGERKEDLQRELDEAERVAQEAGGRGGEQRAERAHPRGAAELGGARERRLHEADKVRVRRGGGAGGRWRGARGARGREARAGARLLVGVEVEVDERGEEREHHCGGPRRVQDAPRGLAAQLARGGRRRGGTRAVRGVRGRGSAAARRAPSPREELGVERAVQAGREELERLGQRCLPLLWQRFGRRILLLEERNERIAKALEEREARGALGSLSRGAQLHDGGAELWERGKREAVTHDAFLDQRNALHDSILSRARCAQQHATISRCSFRIQRAGTLH